MLRGTGHWESELQMVHGSTAQPVIRQDERDHRFCDRYRAWAETWVVTPMHFKINRHTVLGH
jgi:hypothetical protein